MVLKKLGYAIRNSRLDMYIYAIKKMKIAGEDGKKMLFSVGSDRVIENRLCVIGPVICIFL